MAGKQRVVEVGRNRKGKGVGRGKVGKTQIGQQRAFGAAPSGEEGGGGSPRNGAPASVTTKKGRSGRLCGGEELER